MSAPAAVDRPSNAPEACVGPASDEAGKASACAGCPNQAACAAGEGKKEDPALREVAERLANVKHKILVLSGKGGVGKSTFSSQLSWTLASQGYQVGILDIDICGPSVPRMLGVESHEVRKSNYGWSPVYARENLGVMSVGFMLGDRNDAVIWRGPRKNGLIKQFLTDVEWGELDFLIVDAPPGTSDEHISICQYLKGNVDGAVIVTTPQEMALLDVRKEITFAQKVGVPVLGVVENMAGFICPGCHTKSDIFPGATGGAQQMAGEMKSAFLGSIPLDPNLLQACESGVCFVETYPKSTAVAPLKAVVAKLLQTTPGLAETAAAQAQTTADTAATEATPTAATAAATSTAAAAASPAAAGASNVSFALVYYGDNNPAVGLLLGVEDGVSSVLCEQFELQPETMQNAPALLTHDSRGHPTVLAVRQRTFVLTGRSCTVHAAPPALLQSLDVARMQRLQPNAEMLGQISIPIKKAIMSCLILNEVKTARF